MTMTGQDAADGRRSGHSRLFVKEGKIVKETPDQDAAKRAESVGIRIMRKYEHLYNGVTWVVIAEVIDTAVAEAVKDAEYRLGARLRNAAAGWDMVDDKKWYRIPAAALPEEK